MEKNTNANRKLLFLKFSLVVSGLCFLGFSCKKQGVGVSKTASVQSQECQAQLPELRKQRSLLQQQLQDMNQVSQECKEFADGAINQCKGSLAYQAWIQGNSVGANPCAMTGTTEETNCMNRTAGARLAAQQQKGAEITAMKAKIDACMVATADSNQCDTTSFPGSQFNQSTGKCLCPDFTEAVAGSSCEAQQDSSTDAPAGSSDARDCAPGGVKEGQDFCHCVNGDAGWLRGETDKICRNYGKCSSTQYLSYDGRCIDKDKYPSSTVPTNNTSCPAGQILTTAGSCITQSAADKFTACQARGGILYTDGSCRDSSANVLP